MKNQKQTENTHVGKIISDNEPLLKNFIRKRVSNKSDADDILQDVFLQLINTVNDAVSPIEQVTAWLYKVARNTIINKGKKKTEEEIPSFKTDNGDEVLQDFAEILFNDESPSPETEYMRSLVWEELQNAIEELPKEQQEAFELTELDGLSTKEAAVVAEVSVNTLLSRKHYAILHLRKRLKELYDDLLYN